MCRYIFLSDNRVFTVVVCFFTTSSDSLQHLISSNAHRPPVVLYGLFIGHWMCPLWFSNLIGFFLFTFVCLWYIATQLIACESTPRITVIEARILGWFLYQLIIQQHLCTTCFFLWRSTNTELSGVWKRTINCFLLFRSKILFEYCPSYCSLVQAHSASCPFSLWLCSYVSECCSLVYNESPSNGD